MSDENAPAREASRDRSGKDGLMPFSRALLLAIALEAIVVLYATVNWSQLFPKPVPPPMKVEFVKAPEPPPPPPAPPQPKPKPKKKKPKPPTPPKPEDKPVPAQKPPEPEPEPTPKPPPPEPPRTDLPPPKKRAKPVKKPPAVYPKDALSQGLEGRVRVRLLVSGTGKVLKVEVIESEPPGVFDYSAIHAARDYLFPPDENGVEQFQIDQVFVYRLEDDRYGPESRPKKDQEPDRKEASPGDQPDAGK
ncbi:MAG: TonB family protein [Betaproteobacteria bacterium]|nr:TonB family protein [Betaproteobacteria bacterium]